MPWKSESHDVPLRHGTDIYGTSRKGPNLSIAGIITQNGYNGTPFCGESAQVQVAALIWGFFTSVPDDGFSFFLYSSNELEFRKLYPTSIDVSFGDDDQHVIPYNLQFVMGDPNLYVGGTAVSPTYSPSEATAADVVRSV